MLFYTYQQQQRHDRTLQQQRITRSCTGSTGNRYMMMVRSSSSIYFCIVVLLLSCSTPSRMSMTFSFAAHSFVVIVPTTTTIATSRSSCSSNILPTKQSSNTRSNKVVLSLLLKHQQHQHDHHHRCSFVNLRGGSSSTSNGNSNNDPLNRNNKNDSSSSSSSQLSMSSSSSSSSSTESTSTTTSSSVSLVSSPSSSSSSWWDHVPMGESDSILGIAQAYRECTNPNKVNICVGAYRTNIGIPYILPTVQQVEEILLQQQIIQPNNINKEYLPIDGDNDFIKVAIQFAYGTEILNQYPYIAAVQTLSGTGACRIGGHFLQQFMMKQTTSYNNDNDNESLQSPTIYIPNPTWGNHWKIFKECGLQTKSYRYYDFTTNQLDITGLLEDLYNAPNHSIILLHVCAHNPTGCDPTIEQWECIGNLLAKKQHVCFFDSAYQGFASGNSEKDAYALRYIVQRNDIPVILAQSFAKNFGLYGERVGTLSVVCKNKEEKENVISQLKNIIRPMYSSPPKHGSNIVKMILMNTTLTEQYYNECRNMAERILLMRQLLVKTLYEFGSIHDWSHIVQQIGMFAYTGMNSQMCDILTNEYAIYLTRDGRISLAGLNEDNIKYVANAIHMVTKDQSITSSSSS